MGKINVSCNNCGKIYFRETRRVNEAKKFHWKQYCSLECQRLAKNKKITISCRNPLCHKNIERTPRGIAKNKKCFCSRSCSATFYNSKLSKKRYQNKIDKKTSCNPKLLPIKCQFCGKYFYGIKKRKYCSVKCYPHRQPLPKEKIIEEIQQFYNQQGRIPFKKEYFHWKAARTRFGTWNKAIEASGFDPNPVKFAKKYIATDGHKCDSLSEKIIDDWLFKQKIPHEINARYFNTKFTADFKVKDIFIEFFGLHKELKRYDQLMKIKLKIIKKNNLKLIAIYPKDIFPKLRLNEILDDIIS